MKTSEGMTAAEILALPALITREQAARVMGASEFTVWRQLKAGKIKAVKVGSRWRINKAALLASLGLGEAA